MVISFSKLGNYGRFGNQMFQVASTIGIARSIGADYAFPKWRDCFDKPLPLMQHEPKLIYVEKQWEYHTPEISKVHSTDLEGYFQSEKYWLHCIEEVLSYFQFKEEILRRVRFIWAESLSQFPVAIHVRRGDYLQYPDHFKLLGLDYYQRAINQFDRNQRFIVFSDDIEWCMKNFVGSRFDFSTHNEVDDMCLGSLCNGGHIIGNSSYSWWFAYLANSKRVYAPKEIFGPALPHDTKNWHLPNWIKI